MLEANKNSPEWFTTWMRPEQTKLYCWVGDEMNVNPELAPLVEANNAEVAAGRSPKYLNCQGVPYYNIQSDIDSGLISNAFARQEYLNDVVSHIVGGYYGYEMDALEKRGGLQSIDPFLEPVYTFWDLGGQGEGSDATCILFAHINPLNKTARIVDYYENTGKKRGHYFEVLKQKGYRYAGHYFPHDGKRSNEWTGETSADTAMIEHGVEVRFIPKTKNVLNDIEISRRTFVDVTIDPERCGPLIEHLGNYHEKRTTGKPCHQNNCSECNGASHGADTYREMCVGMYLNLVEPYLVEDNIYRGWRYREEEEEELDEYFIH
jgi:hypothetical protein